jgi:outer membrane immunogenic protein
VTWTSCSLGGLVGITWGQSQHTEAGFLPPAAGGGQPITPNFSLTGAVGGGEAGCDYQFGSWVVGFEGDWTSVASSGQAFELPPFTVTFFNNTNQRWVGTARGRVGWTTGNDVFYVTGGAAWTKIDAVEGPPAFGGSDSRRMNGYAIGVGWERLLTSHYWSYRVEYLYENFGMKQFFSPPIAPGPCGCLPVANVKVEDHVLRFGLAKRFGLQP